MALVFAGLASVAALGDSLFLDDMLQAMNTGHEGSLTTVHANSQPDALSRIENMVSIAHLSIPERAVRRQIATAIHAVVQVSRLSDGTRKVMTILRGDVNRRDFNAGSFRFRTRNR